LQIGTNQGEKADPEIPGSRRGEKVDPGRSRDSMGSIGILGFLDPLFPLGTNNF